ncbi:MAG: hypothetical protein ABSC94_33585 [Polyangiaceae bacterium]|jgi:hypothetical protein
MPAKTIEISSVAELQERLRGAPNREETRIRYVKAIELMASDIHAMRSKGYSWNDIAAMLAEKGLQMSASTLRTYLGRTGATSTGESTRRKRRRRDNIGATIRSTVRGQSPALAVPIRGDPPVTVATTSRPTQPSTVNVAGDAPAAPSPRDAEKVPSWSFAMRPDTPNL